MVVYGGETWSLTLRESYRLGVSETYFGLRVGKKSNTEEMLV
jgi:hypothetical protein